MVETPFKSPEHRETEPFGDLAIFTTTLYKDDAEVTRVRKELTFEALARASRLGVDVVVVDGGSEQEFLEKLKEFGNVKTIPEPPRVTMGEGRRVGLREAMKYASKPYFLWIEPEKTGLIEADNLEMLLRPLREGEADIVVPKRSEAGMRSLTDKQRWFESRANSRATRIMYGQDPSGKDDPEGFGEEVLDLWFGPKAFNRQGAEEFLNYQARPGGDRWDAIIVPVINAFKKGLRVVSVKVDFAYDERQTKSELGNKVMFQKRLDQYKSILDELGDTSHL